MNRRGSADPRRRAQLTAELFNSWKKFDLHLLLYPTCVLEVALDNVPTPALMMFVHRLFTSIGPVCFDEWLEPALDDVQWTSINIGNGTPLWRFFLPGYLVIDPVQRHFSEVANLWSDAASLSPQDYVPWTRTAVAQGYTLVDCEYDETTWREILGLMAGTDTSVAGMPIVPRRFVLFTVT